MNVDFKTVSPYFDGLDCDTTQVNKQSACQLLSFDFIYKILSFLPLCQNHPLAKGATLSNAVLLRSKINENRCVWDYGCNTTEKCIHFIGKWKVTALNLTDCSFFTVKGFDQLKQFPYLTDLNLTGCTPVNDQVLAQLKEMPLTSLNLSFCEHTDTVLAFLSTTLTSLDLSNSEKLTDAGLMHLGKLSSLTHLDLSECTLLTSRGLSHLESLPLTYLNLNCMLLLTDGGLLHLKSIRSLCHLDLSFSEYITDFGIAQLKDLHSLTYLNVAYCGLLTEEGFEQLRHLPLSIPLNMCTSEVPELLIGSMSFEKRPENELELRRKFYRGMADSPSPEVMMQSFEACKALRQQ